MSPALDKHCADLITCCWSHRSLDHWPDTASRSFLQDSLEFVFQIVNYKRPVFALFASWANIMVHSKAPKQLSDALSPQQLRYISDLITEWRTALTVWHERTKSVARACDLSAKSHTKRNESAPNKKRLVCCKYRSSSMNLSVESTFGLCQCLNN